MKFDSIVVLEGHFPQGLCLGRQELRCYNIGIQDAQGEARIDERAALVVAFGTTLQEPIPLYGMIDTGSGVSILSLSAYQKIASAHALSLLPYDIQLFAANGKTINTIGIAENVHFQLRGHSLKTNFIVIGDHLGAEDFLLSRNFLEPLEGLRSQGYTNEKVTVRRYEIMQRFIEGVRNFELKRNMALMYAPEQYVEAHPTVEALRFTVQQYLRMRGSPRPENYQVAPQQPQPNQQPKLPLTVPFRSNSLNHPSNNHRPNKLRHIGNNPKEHVLTVATHHLS